MSNYFYNLGESLARVLDGASRSQPEMLAGYMANIEFWLAEYQHVVDLSNGYEARFAAMKLARDAYRAEHGSPHNRDDCGFPREDLTPGDPPHDRRVMLNRCRDLLGKMTERALKLDIVDFAQHDEIMERLGLA